ncbi:nitrogenase iron-molybdenum cofactor biosynthesis protein NifN [Rhodoblastus sphagnicola]|uniref:Nitrogenase iron-molybdenum cofactor biosynthesis protein NifN n=1 Tax=Rhodoblastus sphagnicola TaxID=333368 RepID=A0A2S6N8F6_9HYPH|nr:nitrogenase iron-molybdenum cofactor biosynthesis protein NifN [Rhodoblastus sphagnicola]MBB4198136.1 nitrogenase molybdenum-iron protein NifN [Rhodoblastus sphagnicola]PPQ30902.1 nitrogenase iron-molybdenum cofactor biosynthesis protein NifN [Rhodoblastus sphagnicola]
MAEILTPTKALSVNPLKASQPIGASLAFLGVAECMPLEHGARGCASFNKLFFMRHFNEPIALQTTAMDQTTTVLGADDNVVEALATICAKNAPKVIGLVTTGLSEMQGADVPRTVKEFRNKHPEFASVAVVPVSASDTLGCLETGFATAVESMIQALVPRRPTSWKNRNQINVLASSSLSPGDLEALRAWIEAFGLTPILLPDLGASLDGHLIEQGFSTLTYGGVTREEIESMADSYATLVIGRSMNRAGDALQALTGASDFRFDQLIGLQSSDAFTEILSEISGRPVPPKFARKRDQLTDAMVDCQFQFGGAKVGVAGDSDLLAALVEFFHGMGADVVAAVASTRSARLADLPIEEVVVGDLEDLETLARERGADLIVTNSHGVEVARRTGAALLRAGFPVYDCYGAHSDAWIGYGGTRRLIFAAANLLAAHYQELRPFVSKYKQAAE